MDKRHNCFTKEDVQIAKKHVKRCLTLLTIKKKLKLQCAITIHILEWLTFFFFKVTKANVGKDAEKPDHVYFWRHVF